MPPMNREDAAAFLSVALKGHPEYVEFATGWRWLADSLEGGDRYRYAVYGHEQYLLSWPMRDPNTGNYLTYPDNRQRLMSRSWSLPRRNLIRHRREYPTPERPEVDQRAEFTSTDDEYELRLARTPVPGFVSEAVNIHLGRIYAREVKREAPDNHPIRDWWADVDGRGSSIDDWMREVVAPMLAVLGQLDLIFDHPPAPDGDEPATRADVARLGIDRCVAGYILPENMLWWELDCRGRYEECLVVESWDGRAYPPKPVAVRHWTATDSTLYSAAGEPLETTPHPFGRVPIVRVVDTRLVRCGNVGQSRYAPVAEIQREYYNVDSELVLANTLAAHPILSGPEDYCQGDAIAIGPGNVLPMKKATEGGGGQYQGWSYVSPPNDPSEKLRQRQMDLRDAADRAACLTKPAGASGTGKGTVSQSGISKMMDAQTGNDWLTKQAASLERAERIMAEYVLTVLGDGEPDPKGVAAIEVVYPRQFNLLSAPELAGLIVEFQGIAAATGDCPLAEAEMLKDYERQILIGKEDDQYAAWDAEIDVLLAEKQRQRDQAAEGLAAAARSPITDGNPLTGTGGPDVAGLTGIRTLERLG